MRALTLYQPWSWSICRGPKRIENRKWRPPISAIHTWIAIHAGKRYDTGDAFELIRELAIPPSPSAAVRGAIEGVAFLADVITDINELPEDQQRWFCGPIGWVLGDVFALPEPVPCRGSLGLWRVPDDVEDAVRAQLPERVL